LRPGTGGQSGKGDGVEPAAARPTAKPLGDADLTNKVRTEVLRGLRGDAKGAVAFATT